MEKAQSGFTLIETVVAAGLFGIAALGVGSLLGTMRTTENLAYDKIAKTEFLSAMSVYLHSNLGCDDLKALSVASPFVPETVFPLQLSNWKFQGISVMQSGVEFKEFKVETLEASMPSMTTLPTVTMTYSDGSEKQLKKTLITIKAKLVQNEKPTVSEFNIPVMINSLNNQLEFCGDRRSLAETCTAVGGKFQPTPPKCILKDNCTYYGSFTLFDCMPKFANNACYSNSNALGGIEVSPDLYDTINDHTGIQGCPLGTTPLATGADVWVYTRSCGKKCEVDINNIRSYHTCVKCPAP